MHKELINIAAESLQLEDIYLHSSILERSSDLQTNRNMPEDLEQQDMMEINAELLECKNSSDEKINILRALVKFGARFVTGDKDNQTIYATLEATFAAEYTVLDNLPEDTLEEFLNFNAVHDVWPFWREHTYHVANAANLPRPNIPLVAGQLFQPLPITEEI